MKPLAALAACCLSATCHGEAFTIVALPDTQNYVNSTTSAPLFTQQTQWIADQVTTAGNPRNIQFVTHLGDVVSEGANLTQWQRADASMDRLDGVVPYAILPGNHDYNSTSDKSTGTANYVANFGPQRFAPYPWYGGADPSGNNSFQRFTAGGVEFLHLALEWLPANNTPFRDPSPIAWAQSVLDAHPHLPVILSTHEHIDDNPPGRSGGGQALWDQLVRRNDQVFMVLNGHFHSSSVPTNDGEYHQVSLNDAGRPVFEVLQDYQDYPRGGDGWLRLIEFDLAADRIRFETYSPVLDQFQTETVEQVGQFASQFEFAIDFGTRLVPVETPPPPPEPQPTFSYRNGVGGYAGTLDKEIRSVGGDSTNGAAGSITVDGDDGSPGLQPAQALLRFDDLVGATPGQLPPGAAIERAILTLDVTNEGSGFGVHELLVPWSESSTWAGLAGGVQPDGVEAAATPVATFGADNGSGNVTTGRLEIDVTASVRRFLDGTLENRGWALLPFASGTNGVDFQSSEAPDVAARPLLEVFTRDGDYDFDGDVDADDLARWRADYGGATGFLAADGNRDGVVDAADFTVWRDAFEAESALSVPEPRALPLLAAVAAWRAVGRPLSKTPGRGSVRPRS